MEKERIDGLNERAYTMACKVEEAINAHVLELVAEGISSRDLSVVILKSLSLAIASYIFNLSDKKRESFDSAVGILCYDFDGIFEMLSEEAKKNAVLEGGAAPAV